MPSNQTKSYIYIYMYKEDFALNNQQGLICHQTKPNHFCYHLSLLIKLKQIWIGNVLPQQNCSTLALLLGWGLELFEWPS